MKNVSIGIVTGILLLCLLIFLEVIHTPIYYGKRDLTLVGKTTQTFKEEELETLENIKISKIAYYPLKEMIRHAQKENIFLKLEKGYVPTNKNRNSYDEHPTGLAIDFKELTLKEESWLEENAYRYGFILRYPKGKEKYTKVKSNHYHYRYVGVMDATLIHKKKLCLEEYLKG